MSLDATARRRPPSLQTIVPMKPLAEAKTRLGEGLPALQCRALVLMMLDGVVRAAVDAGGPGSCTVVGGDEAVEQVAAQGGARWTPDPAGELNASVWAAMQEAYAGGARAALFLPGDLPMITSGDVSALLAASEECSRPVAVRAHDGGTNALLQPAASAFRPLLGRGSFAKHRAAADRSGAPLRIVDLPGLAFDIDTRADYEWANDHIAGFAARLSDWQVWLYHGCAGQPPGRTGAKG